MTKKKKVLVVPDKDKEKSILDKKAKRERDGISFGLKLRLASKKQEYIRNLINGRYFMARCNMIAVQIQSKKIVEIIDGCPKSEEFMRAEYAHQKMQAITSMRGAHFSKQDLFKEFKLKEEDILAIEEDYYDGKIIREEYDESYKKTRDAKFVDSPKD